MCICIHRCLKNRRVFFFANSGFIWLTHRERQNSSNEEEKIETFIWYIAKFRYSSSSSFPYININLIKLFFLANKTEKKKYWAGQWLCLSYQAGFFLTIWIQRICFTFVFCSVWLLISFHQVFFRFLLFLMIFSLLLLLLSLLQSLIRLATRTKCFLFFVFWSCLNFFVPFRFVVQFNTSPIGLVWFFFESREFSWRILTPQLEKVESMREAANRNKKKIKIPMDLLVRFLSLSLFLLNEWHRTLDNLFSVCVCYP